MRAMDNLKRVREIPALQGLDHLVIFVDGERLEDISDRHNVAADVIHVTRSIVDSQMLHPGVNCQVVFSKWDLVKPARGRTTRMEFAADIEQDFHTNFDSHLQRIESFEVAARPANTLMSPYGIEAVLESWAGSRASVEAESVST